MFIYTECHYIYIIYIFSFFFSILNTAKFKGFFCGVWGIIHVSNICKRFVYFILFLNEIIKCVLHINQLVGYTNLSVINCS